MQPIVLVVEDEYRWRGLLTRMIALEGYQVLQAGPAKRGLKLLQQEEVKVVVCDVNLPDDNGVELVKRIKELKPYVEVNRDRQRSFCAGHPPGKRPQRQTFCSGKL